LTGVPGQRPSDEDPAPLQFFPLEANVLPVEPERRSAFPRRFVIGVTLALLAAFVGIVVFANRSDAAVQSSSPGQTIPFRFVGSNADHVVDFRTRHRAAVDVSIRMLPCLPGESFAFQLHRKILVGSVKVGGRKVLGCSKGFHVLRSEGVKAGRFWLSFGTTAGKRVFNGAVFADGRRAA
jgi:hypothetical protein